MSNSKVLCVVATFAMALSFATVGYADTGKSQNGAPGPAGNPNQPASTPQANGPQGPAGNDAKGQSGATTHGKSDATHGKSGASHGKSHQSHGKSGSSHGKSGASHGKSNQSHGKSGSHANHANPKPGTPRKGGREDRPAGKITICHATKSVKNPYVEITISVNGLHGHGPAADPRHHEGSWQDIIPAPAGGCPSTVQKPDETKQDETTTTTPTTAPVNTTPVAPAPEVATLAPAGSTMVLGEQASGGSAPAEDGSEPASAVLGAQASGGDAPASVNAARAAGDEGGSLPFTGFSLVFVLVLAAVVLLGGYALRRATARTDA